MNVYKINNDNRIEKIDSKKINETYIHNLISQNLDEFIGGVLIRNEYIIHSLDETGKRIDGKIDSLALGEDLQPIIIGYKKQKSDPIINQGLFNMQWLIDHKESFEREIMLKSIKHPSKENMFKIEGFNFKGIEDGFFHIDDINWEEAKLICLAKSYNKFDEHTISQTMINTDLYVYNVYDDKLFVNKKVSNSKDVKNKTVKKKYDYSENFFDYKLFKSNSITNKMVKLLEEQATHIVSGSEIVYTKYYRGIKKSKSLFTYLIPLETETIVRIFTNNKVLIESGNLFQKYNETHRATGDYCFEAKTMGDIENLMRLLLPDNF